MTPRDFRFQLAIVNESGIDAARFEISAETIMQAIEKGREMYPRESIRCRMVEVKFVAAILPGTF